MSVSNKYFEDKHNNSVLTVKDTANLARVIVQFVKNTLQTKLAIRMKIIQYWECTTQMFHLTGFSQSTRREMVFYLSLGHHLVFTYMARLTSR